MKFLKSFKNFLVPDSEPTKKVVKSATPNTGLRRQDLINSLEAQFKQQLANETTKYSLLFHTSYVVYLKSDDYQQMLQSFPMTCMDAAQCFLDILKPLVAKYPRFKPLFRFWTFQLVCLADDALIDGLKDQNNKNDDNHIILIKSQLWSEDDYNSETAQSTGGNRVVATLHTKNSMKALPKAFDIKALRGFDALGQGKNRVNFDPENVLGLGGQTTGGITPAPTPAPPVGNKAVAKLKIDEGVFIDGETTFTSYQIGADEINICGRNAMPAPNTLKVDSDMVMNPHLTIRRDTASGKFYIRTLGPAVINGRMQQRDANKWSLLPNNTSIIINNSIEISFKTL